MSKECSFLGLPESFEGKFYIFPPKVKEVVGNKNFGIFRHLLTISQEELEDEYLKKDGQDANDSNIPTPFEFLLINCYHDKTLEKITKEAFYFFIKEEVTFLYELKKILIGNVEEIVKDLNNIKDLKLIEEENYFNFQNKIRESLGENPVEPPNPNEHPKIRRMKALARYRDKIKAKQGGGITLLTSLASICCMGIGITPLSIGEMSYAAVGVLMGTYQQKEKYETDVASLQAGADSKKIKPKYWIQNLD